MQCNFYAKCAHWSCVSTEGHRLCHECDIYKLKVESNCSNV
jgi:aspartyl/asparaginyl beta-hydroxylase (cupin superfamily)